MLTKIYIKNIHMCTHTPGLKAPPHIHSIGRTYMGNGVDLHKVFLAFKLDLAKQTPDRILELLRTSTEECAIVQTLSGQF